MKNISDQHVRKNVKICHRKCRPFEQHSFEELEKNKPTMLMLQTKTYLKFSASLSQYFRCLTVYFLCGKI